MIVAATTQRTFAVMGTTATVTVVGDDADGSLAHGAERELLDLHRRWTRFDDASEIGRLNRARGALVLLEPDTHAVVTAAISAWQRTDGRFDPTVAMAMNALGYDADLDTIDPRLERGDDPRPSPGCAGIALDPTLRSVQAPPDVGIDLGGIGKGAAADLVSASAINAGADGVCINLGGDLRVRGVGPDGASWRIELVPTAVGGDAPIVVELNDGAVCTSRTDRRAWTRHDGPAHHVIDPRSGRSTDTTITAVSVLARQAVDAEPLTKAALVAGPADARSVLDAHDAPAVIVTDDGHRHAVGRIREYLAC